MAITVTATFKAVSAEAAEKIAASLTAEGIKFTQDGIAFTVVREFEDADAVKAHGKSDGFLALKERAAELVEGGAEGIKIEKS